MRVVDRTEPLRGEDTAELMNTQRQAKTAE
jgi:hypothetical protein